MLMFLKLSILTHLSFSTMLRINDKNRNLVALLCLTMPQDIHFNVMRDLNTIYTDAIHAKDTRAQGEMNDFESIHFSYYNCYSRRVFIYFIYMLYVY